MGRELQHAEHVELDRMLPERMKDTFLPEFVSLFSLGAPDPQFINFQAISLRDLQSLHRYILSRYDIQDYDEYLHLLALYRNTRAIEVQKASTRFTELNLAVTSVAKARLGIIKAMEDRRSSS